MDKHDMSVPQHNYLAKIVQMWEAGTLPREGGLHQVSIFHDDWCQHFTGGRCDCDPDIRLKWSQPVAAAN
jgi:hypothetical protein